MTAPPPDPARPRKRRWLAPMLAAAAVVAGGYAALWFWAEHQLQQGFSDWAAETRSEGWKVSSSTPEPGTWPFAATLTVPDLSLAGADPDIPGGLSWHAERVVIELTPLHPRVVVIEPQGAQSLRLSTLPELPYAADELRAFLPLRLGAPPSSVDIRARNLRAEAPGRAGNGVAVGNLLLHVRWPAEAGAAEPAEPMLALALRAADVALPSAANWPLGPRMASVSGDATLNGQMPPIASPAQRAAAWRDRGGSLQAQRFTLTWGSLNLSGSASFGLDGKLQPVGSGKARVVDPSETLNALVTHGAITRRTAFAANAVLVLMERAPEGGGAPVVELPLALKDQIVSVANIPLARVPPLVWPDTP